MRDMTVNEIFEEGRKVCEWLIAERGYDNAEMRWFVAHEHSIAFELDFVDDFQEDADSTMRYHSGCYQTIHLESGKTLWTWAAELPSRKQRETAFFIRQLRPIASAAERIKDLEIQEIIQGILGANVSLHNLLEHKLTNNEILFWRAPMPNSRNYNWRHNGLIGSACRGCGDMKRIMNAPSASEEARARAARIFNDMRKLSALLHRQRVNQDGTISEIKK